MWLFASFKLFLFFKVLFVYFWLPWIFFDACRLPPVVTTWGCSLVAPHALLTAVFSLVADTGSQACLFQ